MKSSIETSEKRFLGGLSTASIRNLLPRSISTKHKSKAEPRNPKLNDENGPVIHHNIQIEPSQTSNSISKKSQHRHAEIDTQSEVAAPRNPPLKEHVAVSNGQFEASATSDPPVKVVVRIRPVNDGGERIVRKVSPDSLLVGDRKFRFDSVIDSTSNQEDIFQLVGAPLVKNALAGYNTTILSYGQSGSGKTYTMWGPPSAMVEDPSPSTNQGIVPRIFEMLFSEIQKEQENTEGKQTNYQCRCSFLEIYNEQIGDLLESTQRNLEIKDDQKNGLYVENLSEEYVTNYDDIVQILIKGLSSRKVGATSINSKSSRSHIVFNCTIESWCKETSSKCFSSSKTSRISLVDLAGLDTKKGDDAGRQHVKEGEHVKKSLSRLGHIVNTLGKGIQLEKNEDILYRSSRLTHLLRESLGGNAKLTVLCAIFPNKNNTGEILSTLRFGQQVKSIRNEPVINEITEDDVNDLSDQIRLLKEELIRAKSDVRYSFGSSEYFKGRNVRDSLNLLRVSLNRSLILPRIDNDCEEEVNGNMDDVREICRHLDKLHDPCEEERRDPSDNRDSVQFSSVKASFETDFLSEDSTQFGDESEIEDISLDTITLEKLQSGLPHKENVASRDANSINTRGSITIGPCPEYTILPDPTLSESPKIGDMQKRSMIISPSSLASKTVSESSKSKSDVLRQSLKQNECIRSSMQSSKILPGPTESLAASLQRGLQIIDQHQQNTVSNKSSVAFSFEHLTLKPCLEVDKVNTSVKTLSNERHLDGPSTSFVCPTCQQNKTDDSSKTENPNQLVAGNDLAEAIKRGKELENVCMEQAAKIEQLNCLVEQFKHRKECDCKIADGQENTILCDGSNNRTVTFQDNRISADEDKLGQPEIIKEKCEIEKVSEEGNTCFYMNEKETLLKEIQTLRSKLESYTVVSPKKSTEQLRSSLLSRSFQLRRSVGFQVNTAEQLEEERERWTEMESDWISLTDELRIDLETNRRRAEKAELQLALEKNSKEELDDAVHRAVLGHARMVEHYAELQDKYNDLVGRYRAIMEGIAEVKRAATKAGSKGHGSRFAKSLAAELSALRVEREREKEFLKKENKSLKIQLRDTAEAVHAAGELLVRLREAEQAASLSEENFNKVQQDNEKLSKQMDKLKRKHKMEMITMKQYLADSRLPESAMRPLYREDSDVATSSAIPFADDDQAWRAEFGAIYQEQY